MFDAWKRQKIATLKDVKEKQKETKMKQVDSKEEEKKKKDDAKKAFEAWYFVATNKYFSCRIQFNSRLKMFRKRSKSESTTVERKRSRSVSEQRAMQERKSRLDKEEKAMEAFE